MPGHYPVEGQDLNHPSDQDPVLSVKRLQGPQPRPRGPPQLQQNDWVDAEVAKSTCFDDVTSVHVEQQASHQWALKPSTRQPRSQRGGPPSCGGAALPVDPAPGRPRDARPVLPPWHTSPALPFDPAPWLQPCLPCRGYGRPSPPSGLRPRRHHLPPTLRLTRWPLSFPAPAWRPNPPRMCFLAVVSRSVYYNKEGPDRLPCPCIYISGTRSPCRSPGCSRSWPPAA